MSNLSRVVFLLFIFTWLAMAGMFSVDFISALEKININTAPLEDLVKIIHIGEIRAKELISLRPFSSLDELTKIKGISEKRLEDIKKQGLAWVDTNQLQPEPKIEKPKLITYPSNIVINEILPSPEGPDAKEEWIELFNQNNFEVSLSGWQLKDLVGSTTTFTFPLGTEISSQGFLVLSRPKTKITLNNDGDGLLLLQPDGKITDKVEFEKASRSQSYNLTESGWFWSSTLTPGSANIVPTPSQEEEREKPMSQTEIVKEMPEKELAAIGEQVSRISEPLYVFLIALSLAIFSGIVVLILKKKIKIDFKQKLK